jgi:hypothetical protein
MKLPREWDWTLNDNLRAEKLYSFSIPSAGLSSLTLAGRNLKE